MTLYDRGAGSLTFTTVTIPREYKFMFETNKLQSDRSYTIRCHPPALYSCGATPLRKTSSRTAPLMESCHTQRTRHSPCSATRNEISFSTRSDLPQPPALTVLTFGAACTLSFQRFPIQVHRQLDIPRPTEPSPR